MGTCEEYDAMAAMRDAAKAMAAAAAMLEALATMMAGGALPDINITVDGVNCSSAYEAIQTFPTEVLTR
jgi:hypothetical protein